MSFSSSSRIRSDNATVFDVCCEVYYSENNTSELKVLYPPEYSEESILRSIKQFCFPCCQAKKDENEPVQLFTFVFTDAQSFYRFGYCRFTPRTNSCFCILSGFPWVNLFYKFLNHISTVAANGNPFDVESVLTNAYHVDIPAPGAKFALNVCTQIGRFSETIPHPNRLSTLKDEKSLLEFFNAVNERQMILLYLSLLKERRIIFTTKKLSQLSSCVFGLSKLLYPFYWQGLFIPILPYDLKDMLMAPMPYLIGVPKHTFSTLNKAELGEVVVMHLDEKTLTSPHQDKLPSEAGTFLANRLKFISDVFLSDSFSRAFLQTNVMIFGNYTSGFVKGDSGVYCWDRDTFIEKQRSNIRPFLQSLIGKDGVQYFERFIEERLEALNQDRIIIDEFEREANSMDVRRHAGGNGIMSKPPELIQNAVCSVKENANDVFGALKDQFQSISVRGKLNNTSKAKEREVARRRHRPASSSGRSRSRQTDESATLSIDTSQFDFEKSLVNASASRAQPTPANNESANAHSVEDLIDLSDNTQSTIEKTMKNNVNSSPNLQSWPSNNIPNVMKPENDSAEKKDFSLSLPSNTNTTSHPHSHFMIVKRRSQWETFE